MNGSQSSLSGDTQRARTRRAPSGLALGLCLAISLSLAGEVSASYGGAGAVSPIGPPTVPPSSYEGGLFTQPNPIDSGSNLVVTGNVRGGKYFHGSIPYSSTSSFGAPLGSTRLDSFMRYTAIPQETGDYRPTPGYDTFYSPTGTVSQIRPGQTGVSAPTSPRVAGGIGQWRAEQPADVVDLGDIIQPRVAGSRTSPVLDTRADTWRASNDWSRTPEPMSEIISGQPGRQRADDPTALQADPSMSSQEYQRQLGQFRDQLEKIKADASQLEQSLTVREALPPDASRQAGDSAARSAPGLTPPLPSNSGRWAGADSLWRPASMRPDTSWLTRQTQGITGMDDIGFPTSPAAAPGAPAAVRSKPYTQQTGVNLLTADAATQAHRIAELFRTPGMTTPDTRHKTQDTSPTLESAIRPAPDIEDDSIVPAEPADLSTATQRVVLDAASQEKFDQYMKAAEAYHQQGRYEEAAKSFALASVCNPTDPRVHLGRSLVLLAAGDFASSALYLMKAVELDAQTALAKINLVDLIGGPDPFIERITDLEALAAQASEKPDLQFLLAYMYYEMDRPAEAATAIAAAQQRLPHSRPVALLQAAITR